MRLDAKPDLTPRGQIITAAAHIGIMVGSARVHRHRSLRALDICLGRSAKTSAALEAVAHPLPCLCTDESQEAGLEDLSAAGGPPSDDAPSTVSTEAQGSSGHNDGNDDEAASLPHVASVESVTSAEVVVVALDDSPTAGAACKVCLPTPAAVPSRPASGQRSSEQVPAPHDI